MAELTAGLLEQYEGLGIKHICPHGYDDGDDNHCAHFVSHVLQLDFGMTCGRLRRARNAPAAANVRVHEVFARCPATHEVLECPTTGKGLIFVSHERSFTRRRRRGAGGVRRTELANVGKKHIGIGVDGMIWHYSNARHKVIKQPFSEFLYHFPRQTNALWWGSFPDGTSPTEPMTSSR